MQAFVCAGPPRRRGVNALMLNAEPHPPHVEGGEPAERLRHERRAVIASHRQWEAVLAECALKHRARERALHGR